MLFFGAVVKPEFHSPKRKSSSSVTGIRGSEAQHLLCVSVSPPAQDALKGEIGIRTKTDFKPGYRHTSNVYSLV